MYYHDEDDWRRIGEDDRGEDDTDTYEDKREDTFDNTLGNIKDSLDDIKKELNQHDNLIAKQSAKLKKQLDMVDDNDNDPDLQKIKRVQDLNEVIETLFIIQKESNIDNVRRLCNNLLLSLQPKANRLMKEFIKLKS